MPKSTAQVLSQRDTLLAFLRSPSKQKLYQARGRKAVGSTAKNACAATASQVLFDMAIIPKIETWAETLVEVLKKTRRFTCGSDPKRVKPGFLIVCKDLNGNGATDHVWWVLEDYRDGTYLCFDNQGPPHPRRLDGLDGRTPMRGWMALNG